MILIQAKIRLNINPVAIGAPRIGETCVQITQNPKYERETTKQSSESEEKPLPQGGR